MVQIASKGIIANIWNTLVSVFECLLLFLNSFFALGKRESNEYKKEEID